MICSWSSLLRELVFCFFVADSTTSVCSSGALQLMVFNEHARPSIDEFINCLALAVSLIFPINSSTHGTSRPLWGRSFEKCLEPVTLPFHKKMEQMLDIFLGKYPMVSSFWPQQQQINRIDSWSNEHISASLPWWPSKYLGTHGSHKPLHQHKNLPFLQPQFDTHALIYSRLNENTGDLMNVGVHLFTKILIANTVGPRFSRPLLPLVSGCVRIMKINTVIFEHMCKLMIFIINNYIHDTTN